MKSQEQRITSATLVIAAHLTGGHDQRHQEARVIAIRALEAADTPPPTWPSDASVNTYHDVYLQQFDEPPCGIFEQEREVLRSALLADPIIKAAIAYRDYQRSKHESPWGTDGFVEAARGILDAVDGAGL